MDEDRLLDTLGLRRLRVGEDGPAMAPCPTSSVPFSAFSSGAVVELVASLRRGASFGKALFFFRGDALSEAF